MPKIFIMGIVASGKTTLAKKLSLQLGIPFYEGDCIAWSESKTGRYKRTDIEQQEIIREIDKSGNWIIEGTYRKSYHCLFDMSDWIIFLDTPLYLRKYRIMLRYIKQKLGIEKCHYKSDFKMLRAMFRWTRDFEEDRPVFEKMLKGYGDKLIIIKRPEELRHFQAHF